MFLFFGWRSTKTPLLRQGIIIRVTMASMAQDMPLAAGRWHGSQGPTRHAVGNINEMKGNERSWCEKDDILGLCFLQIERNTMVVTKMVTLSMNMNSLEWFKGKFTGNRFIWRKPPGFRRSSLQSSDKFYTRESALAHLEPWSREAKTSGVAADGHGTWETSEDFNQGIFGGDHSCRGHEFAELSFSWEVHGLLGSIGVIMDY